MHLLYFNLLHVSGAPELPKRGVVALISRVWMAGRPEPRRMRSRLMAHEANMIRKARAHRNREWKPPEVNPPNLQANPLLEYYHEDSPTEPWGCKLICRHARRMLDIYVELDIA